MRRSLSVVLGVSLFCTPTAAETGFLDRTVTMAGATYRFQVYVPADHSRTRSWPVVVFYAQHPSWKFAPLKALDDSPDPVRISGFILMDPVHKAAPTPLM